MIKIIRGGIYINTINSSTLNQCESLGYETDINYIENTRKYLFPTTRYQGSKNKIVNWIHSNTENIEGNSVLDAFGGTGTVSHMFKRAGKTVTYNDLLKFNYTIGKALIENDTVKLTDEDISKILNFKEKCDYHFIEDNYSQIYFTDEENKWLDNVLFNIYSLEGYKKDVAMFALFQACIVKRPYNLFHRANLYVRTSEVKRSFGNKTTWDKPFESHFRKFLKESNSAIFSTGLDCKALNCNVMEIDEQFDMVYIDTPYISSKGVFTNYLDFYHFLEGMSNYDNWSSRINTKYKHKPIRDDTCKSWTNKMEISVDFEKLFNKFSDSKLIVSYRSDGIPSITELKEIMGSYKKEVIVKNIDYQYALSKKVCSEILLIGT